MEASQKKDLRDLLIMIASSQFIAFVILRPAPCPVIEYRTVAIVYLISLIIGFTLGIYIRFESR